MGGAELARCQRASARRIAGPGNEAAVARWVSEDEPSTWKRSYFICKDEAGRADDGKPRGRTNVEGGVIEPRGDHYVAAEDFEVQVDVMRGALVKHRAKPPASRNSEGDGFARASRLR